MFKEMLMRRLFIIVFGLLSAMANATWQQELKQLTDAPGPSGYEQGVRQIIKKLWNSQLEQMTTDGMGNVIGRFNSNPVAPRLLFMAHMDEVGFMVESITKDGFLKVIPLGGISDNVILAQRWVVSTEKGPIIGYSGLEAVHIIDKDNREKSVSKKAMFLDIGASSKQQAVNQFKIRPGLAVSPQSKMVKLSDSRYLAKALDDRIGLAAITQMLKKLNTKALSTNLLLAATVQEEIGLRGAATVYESAKPDVAINVEIGIADDFPLLLSDKGSDIKLGKGPSLFVYDRSMIPNQALLKWIKNLAVKHHIPLQYEVEQGYGEDGARVQLSGKGVPVINIGIPVRYAHEHAGVFDASDYQNAIKLLTLIASNFNNDVLNQIKS
jgi:putative aminopeptidase FrvX